MPGHSHIAAMVVVVTTIGLSVWALLPLADAGSVGFSGTVVSRHFGFGVSPQRDATVTFLDKGAVRFEVINAGARTLTINLESINADRSPARDVELPAWVRLAPGKRRTLVAVIPLNGRPERVLSICATVSGKRSCGEYRVRRH